MEEDKKEELTKNEAKAQENIKENSTEASIVKVEKKQKKIKKQRKGSYILGTIGAILGGAVAAIPWILTYLFANNMVIPLFGTLIPMGAFLGYKIFGGKVRKSFRGITAIISLLIIIVVTTVIEPSILILQSGYELSVENVIGLYSDVRAEIRNTLIGDLIIGLTFAIIGLFIVIKWLINRQIKNIIEEDIKKAKATLQEQSEIIKKVCTDLNCMSKENAIKKKEIYKQLALAYNTKRKKAKLFIANCKSNKLLKKYKGKYYYDETDEQEKIEKVKKVKKSFIVRKIIVLIIIIALAVVTVQYISYLKTEYTLAGTNIKIDVNKDTQDFYGTDEKITEAFGEEAAVNCDFVLVDKANKYEMNGKAVPKSQFEGKDMAAVIQGDKDDFTLLLGEEAISEITDKQLGEPNIKSYNFTYTGMDENEYRAVVYLCEAEYSYVWLTVYADKDLELTQIDTLVDNFIK